MDDKSRQCVLLGVSNETKDYKLFYTIENKVIVSRDMVFEDDKHWNWDEGKTKSTPTAPYVEDQDEDESEDSTLQPIEVGDNTNNPEIKTIGLTLYS